MANLRVAEKYQSHNSEETVENFEHLFCDERELLENYRSVGPYEKRLISRLAMQAAIAVKKCREEGMYVS